MWHFEEEALAINRDWYSTLKGIRGREFRILDDSSNAAACKMLLQSLHVVSCCGSVMRVCGKRSRPGGGGKEISQTPRDEES